MVEATQTSWAAADVVRVTFRGRSDPLLARVSALSRTGLSPRLHRCRPEGPKGGSGDQVTLDIEIVVHGSMG